jgi:hypothetical protein
MTDKPRSLRDKLITLRANLYRERPWGNDYDTAKEAMEMIDTLEDENERLHHSLATVAADTSRIIKEKDAEIEDLKKSAMYMAERATEHLSALSREIDNKKQLYGHIEANVDEIDELKSKLRISNGNWSKYARFAKKAARNVDVLKLTIRSIVPKLRGEIVELRGIVSHYRNEMCGMYRRLHPEEKSYPGEQDDIDEILGIARGSVFAPELPAIQEVADDPQNAGGGGIILPAPNFPDGVTTTGYSVAEERDPVEKPRGRDGKADGDVQDPFT